MSSFLFNKKEEVSLLVHIGSGNIFGALVVFGGNKKPVILCAVKTPFHIGEEIENSNPIIMINTPLNKTIEVLMKKSLGLDYFKNRKKNISSAVVSLSSPWFSFKSKHIDLKNENSFIISERFIKNVLDTEEKIFEDEIISTKDENIFLPAGEKDAKNLKVMEKSVISSKINGYNIENCVNRETKNFEASIYMSIVPSLILDVIHKNILKHIHIHEQNVHIHTFSLVSFTVIRNLFPEMENFLFMNATAETTDISLVLDNSIVEKKSFPFGRNLIIRQIAKSFSVSTEIAESLLHMYNSKETDEETDKKIQAILDNAEKEWAIYFEDIFSELSENSVLPTRLYMIAEEDISPLYVDFLKTPKFDSTSVFRKNIELICVNGKTLSDFYDSPGLLQNEPITILAIFCDHISTNKFA